MVLLDEKLFWLKVIDESNWIDVFFSSSFLYWFLSFRWLLNRFFLRVIGTHVEFWLKGKSKAGCHGSLHNWYISIRFLEIHKCKVSPYTFIKYHGNKKNKYASSVTNFGDVYNLLAAIYRVPVKWLKLFIWFYTSFFVGKLFQCKSLKNDTIRAIQ